MDVDYREVFYKQISSIDRVVGGGLRNGANGDTPACDLMMLENYDEHASLYEILFGM